MGLLGIVFVTLKLCGVINWSWWWVTAPFWGGAAIGLLVLLCIVIGALVAVTLASLGARKAAKRSASLDSSYRYSTKPRKDYR